ncbi:MAG: glycosyltransferase [Nanoarchaeota archaeon]
MYSLKDVSVIIPTYNRADDLRETLDSFKEIIPKIGEVIVVDQSTEDKTKKLVQNLKNAKIRYIYSSAPSLTRARNAGIKKISRLSRIVLFLDDDVSLERYYFEEILRVFNDNPEALGASGYYLPPEIKMGKTETALRKMFYIEHKSPNSARVLSAYGTVYPSVLTKVIMADWLSGFNMAFKREVFQHEQFDENLSQYALGEDFDFSYRVHLRRPASLYLTPYAKLIHRVSSVERVPTRKINYMNQIYHFYFNFKNFNRTALQKIAFAWAVFGITILRTWQFIGCPTLHEGLRLRYYISSLWYCLKYLSKIRRGEIEIPENTI